MLVILRIVSLIGKPEIFEFLELELTQQYFFAEAAYTLLETDKQAAACGVFGKCAGSPDADLRAAGIAGILFKPVERKDLADAIRRTIDEAHSR